MIRMIATDLDGTLLATGGMTVPERNLLLRRVSAVREAALDFEASP